MLSMLLAVSFAAAESLSYEELGVVSWHRSFDEAKSLSSETGKPLLILFQEVPGCATCVNYGRQVLSHPLVAEAIETYFIPLAVFNNRGGEDGIVMKHFNEPPWNNPVLRIIDYHEKPLANRLAGDYSIAGTTGAMIKALEKSRKPVPEYLRIVNEENRPFIMPEKAVFSTFCFWSGEIELGKIEGVVATTAGFMHGKEVVEVMFNSETISYTALLQRAGKNGVARNAYVFSEEQENAALHVLGESRVAWAKTFHPDRQTKYYLSKTPYSYIPLTSLQAIRINRALYEQENPDAYLSPRQRKMLSHIIMHPDRKWQRLTNHADIDFAGSWNEVARIIGPFSPDFP